MVMGVVIMMRFQSLDFWLFYLLLLICLWQKKEEGREIHKQSNQSGRLSMIVLDKGFMYNILQFGLDREILNLWIFEQSLRLY